MIRVIKYVVCTMILMLLASDVFAAVPANPSIVSISGKQMRIRHRREDNTLKATTNYVIKGVGYSVSTVWPVETYPPGAPFENDDRRRSWEMAQYDFPRIKEAGFNTIRLYSDLGLDTDASLYFDEDSNDVIWNADGTAQDDDSDHQEDWLQGMAMVGDLKAQSVTNGLAVLDEAYKNGLKVVMVVDGLNANSALAQKIVNTYKNHPAILMWQLGNEFNYNYNDQHLYMWRYDTFLEACQAVDAIAEWIKANDNNHPVTVCLGEPSIPSYDEYKSGVSAMNDIDALGINCYRGQSFKDLYEVIVDTITCNKPIFFSEYGVDSWHYDSDPNLEFEDIASQKEGIAWQWDDIHSHLSSNNANDNLLGGFVFEWVDEWWKLKSASLLVHNTDPGYPINDNQPPSTDLYPDGCMHEEWWGLNSQDKKGISPIQIYCDAGLIGESKNGSQSWDIYSWGLPATGTGHGKLNSQTTYVDAAAPDYGVRKTYSPYPEYTYTGGTGSGNIIPEGQRCLYTEIWGANYGGGWGIFRTKDAIDFSQYANGDIKFCLKIQKAGTPPIAIGDTLKAQFFLKFEDENGPQPAVFIFLDDNNISGFNANSTDWQELSIPVSALTDNHSFAWIDGNNVKHSADGSHLAHLNLSKLKMVFSLTSPKVQAGDTNYQYWVDNVRWDTGSQVVYNRTAKPALKAYRDKFNTLSYLKTVFESGATSDMGEVKNARVTKNYSAVVSTYTVATPQILAAAINPKTGRIVSSQQFTDANSLNNWVDLYDNAGNDYILSFAKYNSVNFLSSCTKLGTIGSTLYSSAASNDPWVFVTHAVDGSAVAKKESTGANSVAEVYLSVEMDTDNDGITNVSETDSDGDGLSDVLEIRYGTDPLNTDSDYDTYSDSAEVTNNTNARNQDSKVLATDAAAVLQVQPGTLLYGNTEIQSNKDRYLYIENDGGKYLSYKVDIAYTNGNGWIAVKYRDHASNEAWTPVTTGSYLYKDLDDYVLQVLVDTTTMTTAQNYAGTVTITAQDNTGAAAGTKTIGVTVPIAPELGVYPSDPANIIVAKPDTTNRFYVNNNGCATMNYSLSQINPVSWITLDPTSGSATTEVDSIDVTVDWDSITVDTYTVIKIDAGSAGVNYITVNLDDKAKYGLNTALNNADGSYIGLHAADFLEQDEMATGDVNGDGIDDILTGVLQYTTGSNRKAAYLILGKKDGLHMDAPIADAIQFNKTPDDNGVYGGSGVAIADVDGDGYKDIIIGDKCALTRGYGGKEYWQCMSGCIYIYFNPLVKGEIWRSNYSLMDADVIIRSCFETGQPNGYEDFGDVIGSGDFNNDGYDDLVVGGDNMAPAAYIIWGRQQSEWDDYLVKDLLANDPNNYSISLLPRVQNPDHSTNFPDVTRIYHSQRGWLSYHNFYQWVDHITVGDLDGDGYDDIVLGNLELPDNSGNWYRYVVYGQTGKQSSWGGNIDIYNNSDIIPIKSVAVSPYTYDLGDMSATADVNGDDCYDLLISTSNASLGNGDGAYLLLGNSTKWTSEKVLPTDADASFTFPSIDMEGYPGDARFTAEAVAYAVHLAKDFNNDGYGDIYILSRQLGHSGGTGWRSISYAYLGRSNISGTIDMGDSANASFVSDQVNDLPTGGRINSIRSGDFNGDGYADLVEVHELNDERVADSGQMYIILSKKFITSVDELVFRTDSETSKTFRIKNESLDDQAIDWTATEDISWVTNVSPDNGADLAAGSATNITVTVDRSGLDNGIYIGDITLASGAYSKKVKMKLYVGNTRPPVANASPEHVVISGSSTGSFDLTNIGGGTMNWAITENEPWITNISANSGTTATETDTVTVTVDSTTYSTSQTGKVVIAYDNGVQKDVYVTMKISSGDQRVRIGDTYYSTIQAAYNAASSGNIIKCKAGTFNETPVFNRAINIDIQGGYNADWSTATGITTITGNLTEESVGGLASASGTGEIDVQ